MSLLIAMPDRDSRLVEATLRENGIDVQLWPELTRPDDIIFAVTWNHPAEIWPHLPNLRAVSSFGAGVDHLLTDRHLPRHLTLTRIVEDRLKQNMGDYVLSAILNYRRRWPELRFLQRRKTWHSLEPRPGNRAVVLGLGELGGHVAQQLGGLGLSVAGWSRTPRNLSNVDCFHGSNGLESALANANYLICMLPLTQETRHILAADLFAKLGSGCYLINVARGAHLLEADLIPALESGRLGGACLDVFEYEPLPLEHPFWSHPAITVTPHVSSQTDPVAAAEILTANYRRLLAAEPPLFQVSRERGY